jgi:hypothetical protein
LLPKVPTQLRLQTGNSTELAGTCPALTGNAGSHTNAKMSCKPKRTLRVQRIERIQLPCFVSEPNGIHYAACLTRRAFFFHWDAEALPVYAITETRLVPAKVRVLIDSLTDQFTRD